MMATKGSVNNHQHRSASTGKDLKIDSEYNDFLFNITQNSCDFVQSRSQSFNKNSSRYTGNIGIWTPVNCNCLNLKFNDIIVCKNCN